MKSISNHFMAFMLLVVCLVFSGVETNLVWAKTKIQVNGAPISSAELSSRTNLLKAMTRKSTKVSRKEATNQLIMERILEQEAKRRGVTVADAEINKAYANFAKRVNLTPAKLNQALKQMKVSKSTLRNFLKYQIVRNSILVSLQKDIKVSPKELKDALKNEDVKTELTFDFLLQQVTFIKSKKRSIEASLKQARSFKPIYPSCEAGAKASKAYRDVAVRKIGRRSSTKLLSTGVPENIVKQLEALPVGGISDPFPSEMGAEMLGICLKSAVQSDEMVRRKVRLRLMEEKYKGMTQNYFEDLKSKAKIVYL